jgi:hypothetical protein
VDDELIASLSFQGRETSETPIDVTVGTSELTVDVEVDTPKLLKIMVDGDSVLQIALTATTPASHGPIFVEGMTEGESGD